MKFASLKALLSSNANHYPTDPLKLESILSV